MRKLMVLTLLFAGFTWAQKYQDKVELKSGAVLVGTVKQIDVTGDYHIQLEDGSSQIISKDDIKTSYKVEVQDGKYHTHDGFYLSIKVGPSFGDAVYKSNSDDVKYSGTSFLANLQLGYAVTENWIVSFSTMGHTLSDPTITSGSTKLETSDVTHRESLIGLGLRYYWMPQNIFLGTTLGVASYEIEDANGKGQTEDGFGVMVEAGKEWWVSTNWGLGVAGQLGYSSAEDGGEFAGNTMSRFHFGITFSATYN
jgi:hypothetical protein